jgi:hypothetical protein
VGKCTHILVVLQYALHVTLTSTHGPKEMVDKLQEAGAAENMAGNKVRPPLGKQVCGSCHAMESFHAVVIHANAPGTASAAVHEFTQHTQTQRCHIRQQPCGQNFRWGVR